MFFVTGEYRAQCHLISRTPRRSKKTIHTTQKAHSLYLLKSDKMAPAAGIKLVTRDWNAFWMVIK